MVSAALGDVSNWDDRFTLTGADGAVQAMAVAGSDVYVGGGLTAVGVVVVNHIAKYTGATGTWSALGNGVNGGVEALAVSGGTVYAGGNFTQLCANTDCSSLSPANGVNHLAAFSGGSWSALGNGVNNTVFVLAVNGGTVEVGGAFTRLCGNADCSSVVAANGVNHIGAFNAGSWSALGNGVNLSVFALAVSGSTVDAGGAFTQLCGNADCSSLMAANGVNYIAAFSGGSWSALGNGVNDFVFALAVSGSTVDAGGNFTRLCANADCSSLVAANGVNYLAAFSGGAGPPSATESTASSLPWR
jgi:hypothetical protein